MGYAWENITPKEQKFLLFRREQLLAGQTKAEKAFQRIVDILCETYNQRQRILKYRLQEPYCFGENIVFYVDIYFPKFHMGVEIDGSSHYSKRSKERDEWRSRLLFESRKDTIIRFSNAAVLRHPESIAEMFVAQLISQENATPSYVRSMKHLALKFPPSHLIQQQKVRDEWKKNHAKS